jgi:hypothetical protein
MKGANIESRAMRLFRFRSDRAYLRRINPHCGIA